MQQSKNLLIIDDDPIYLFGISRILSTMPKVGSIKIANNGQEGFDLLCELLKENEPELPNAIILDLNMPIMDGWDFLHIIKDIKPLNKIPIYIVSSTISQSEHTRTETYIQVKGFIIKPITRDILDGFIEKL